MKMMKGGRSIPFAVGVVLSLSILLHCAGSVEHSSDDPRHPLDPLTVKELNRVRAILSAHSLFKGGASHALHSVVLEEPPKPAVLSWKEGDPLLPRRANVVALVSGAAHEWR